MNDCWGKKHRLQHPKNLAFDNVEKFCEIIMFAIRPVAWTRERE
jgi:hypothetical protein